MSAARNLSAVALAKAEARLGPLINQPLTRLLVGGFFFGAKLAPGLGGDL